MSGVMEGPMGSSGGACAPACRTVVRRAAGRCAGARGAREEVVLRLLRGEGLDALARETGQPAGRISAWRGDFLAAGREGLKSCPAPEEDRRLVEAQRKVGELALELDILRALNEEMDRRPRRPRR
jgi:hypothetical protein